MSEIPADGIDVKMRHHSILLSGICLLFSIATHAEVYKWTGPDGRVHYGDNPPTDTTSKSVQSANVAVPLALAEVEIEESSMKYFPIYGTTPRELQASILANGPFNEIVKRNVNAECGWRLNWRFDYVRDKGQCKIGKFKIMLRTEITFPKWMNPEAGDESVRSLWKRVSKDIRVHEDGHKANGIEAANVLARRLRALPEFESCEALNTEISREGKRIYAEYSLLNRAYDRTEALKIQADGRFAEK